MWRYILMRLNGDGTMTPVHWDVPLSGAKITTDLSGPGGITGALAPEFPDLKDADGRPLIIPWQTAIFAEQDGHIRGGAIVIDPTENSGSLQLDAVGYTGIWAGMPWIGEMPPQIQKDPLDMARLIVAHAQAQPGGNLGLTVDSTTSPVRVGTEQRDVEFTAGNGDAVSFQAGPYQLADWKTHDIGKEFDDLATGTPFDYIVRYRWDPADDENVLAHLVLAYPKLGRRLHALRFVTGENITEPPAVDYAADDYANAVLVLGAGEGRAMVRAYGANDDGRLRRVAVVEDSSITSKTAANVRVAEELRRRRGVPDISGNVTVKDHPNAPIGSFGVGDEILVETGDQGWSGNLAVWVRILSIGLDPQAGTATLSVMQTERLGR